MIRVLLADDHAVLREGLRALLEAQPGIAVVAGVANGREALRDAKRLQPDVVLMDIAMPDLNGIEATLQMRDACPSTQVLILSMHSTAEHILRALQAGARGYLLKESAGAEVADAVRAVHAGRRYLGQKIAATVIDDYAGERRQTSRLDILSRRERQILQLVRCRGREARSHGHPVQPRHPGVEEPHYHVVQWMISPAEVKARMQ